MDNLVYHYTTLEALKGIIKDDICLWATRYDHLNDPHEQIWAKDVILNYSKQSPYKDSMPEENIEQWFAKYSYILSLCEKADYRNMWRLYCNDGKGVALGLDAEILSSVSKENSFRDPQHSYDVFEKIKYSSKAEVDSAIKYWQEKGTFNRFPNEPFDELMNLSAFIKDEDFDIEHEIRYARIREISTIHVSPKDNESGSIKFKFRKDDTNVKYRVRGEIEIVPYIELHFPANAIKSITIGYGYCYEDMEAFVRSILDGKGELYKKVCIYPSLLQ